VVHLKSPERWNPLLSAIKEKTKSKWSEIEDIDFEVIYRKRDVTFSLISRWGNVELVLAGPRGAENTLLALTMFEELGFSPEEHLEAIQKVYCPCRMQRVSFDEATCPVFLSGDYTPYGMISLIELLDYYPRKRLHILLGVNMGQDVDELLAPLFKLKDAQVYLTRTPRRSIPLRGYGRWYRRAKGAWASPKVAIKKITEKAHREDMILVTGSMDLVGRVKEILQIQESKSQRDKHRLPLRELT
jgi:folylpolyglutamate synthase/dihydropteroate synthase